MKYGLLDSAEPQTKRTDLDQTHFESQRCAFHVSRLGHSSKKLSILKFEIGNVSKTEKINFQAEMRRKISIVTEKVGDRSYFSMKVREILGFRHREEPAYLSCA